MIDPKELFQPGRYESSQDKEAELTSEQIVNRGRMMRDLQNNEAFQLIDANVSESIEYLMAEIEVAKDPFDVKRLQGNLTGIKALRLVVLGFIEKADQIHNSLQQEQVEAQQAGPGQGEG